MHSTASDGAVPAAEVVAAAARAGLAAIALTDHDTVAGVSEASRAAEQLHHLRVVPGVELSAHEGSAEVHLLGLHLARLGEMERDLAQFRAARHARAERIVGRLNALGVPVTMDAVIAEAAGGAIGRPHVARALVAGGWARDFRDAFDRYLGMGRPAHVAKEHFALGDAIALVHRAGGLAILAHPGASATRERLERFLAIGLDGVEVRHPSHPPAEVQRIGRLAAQLGLVPSGGSDWHGALEGTRTIGVMQVPAEWLSEQDARVRERARRANVA
ncbi:MAG TPA: PHP domain-containing protein [Gemmatimonadaceae bacterium]|nr:PHP domain-containing protein [Gemmatimonadaceae bacterium]